MPTLHIHCGLHKTGTTSLQSTLWDNAGILKSRGLLYPEVGVPNATNLATGDRFSGQHGIAWQLARDRRFDETEGTFAELLQAVDAFGADAVISSEDFEASLLHPDVWMPFANVAAGKGVALHFIVYLRDVPGYIESLYLEQASSQHGHEYALYAREALQHGRLMINEMEFCFHFDRVQSGLRAVPNSKVTFRSYNDLRSGSIVQDFLSVIDPTGGLGGAIGPERRQNSRRDPSVSFEVYLRSRDIRINREGERPSQLVADAFKGRSPKLTAPRRMRAALAARLSTTAFAGREDYARKFLEASRPDYLPVADEGEQLVNIARVFSVESQVLFRRILRLEAIGRASPEWRARQLDDWWSWISDIS